MMSPLSRLMAEITAYGGFTMDRPCTFSPPMGPAAGAGGVVGAATFFGWGASAALPKPGPSATRNSKSLRPIVYLMSVKPSGGVRRVIGVTAD